MRSASSISQNRSCRRSARRSRARPCRCCRKWHTEGGRVAVIAQSGAIGFGMFDRGRLREIPFRYVVTTGNEAGLRAFDLVEYMLEEDETDVFCLFVEDIRDGDQFRRVAARALKENKPIVMVKVGRSQAAQESAASHTGAMAGSDRVNRAVLEEYGVTLCDDLDGLVDIVAAFHHNRTKLPQGGASRSPRAPRRRRLDGRHVRCCRPRSAGARRRGAREDRRGATRLRLVAQSRRRHRPGGRPDRLCRAAAPRLDVQEHRRQHHGDERAQRASLHQGRGKILCDRPRWHKPVVAWTYTWPTQETIAFFAAAGVPLYTATRTSKAGPSTMQWSAFNKHPMTSPELKPSSRAAAIPESITLAISARAQAMVADGHDVISLSAGEPDFPTVEGMAQAGVQAIESADTRYTPASGKPALRQAAAGWFSKHFGLDYDASEVMVTAGAKPALTMALMAMLEPGDKVLLPSPYWASYTAIIEINGGVPIDVPAVPDQGFVHTGAQIAAAAKEHGARGIVLNFPNNPSGCVPTRDQVADLVRACVDNNLWIISDEIYARLLYDGAKHVSPAEFPEARNLTVVVNGGTKSHSMTGWRVGFVAGPKPIIAAAARLQSQAIGNACTISQAAAMALCAESDDSELKRRIASFDERRRFVVDKVNAIPGLSLELPKGAFYALVDARAACERFGIDDVQLTEKLLNEALVAVVPGSAFAAPGFLRFSYAASMEDLAKALERVAKLLAS